MFAARRDGQGGVEPVALQLDRVAEAVGVLVHAVQAEGDLVVQRLVEVAREALVAVGAALQGDLAQGLEAGLLGHPVHDPAAASAPEHHGVRALQGFDAIEVVEVAVVLHVVAHAVQEEVGGGAVAADD